MFLKFLRNCRGSVLPTFAIAAVPLIVATGAVVDYSRAFDQRTVVQDAMDASALASGKMIGIKTDPQIKAEAQAFFSTNVGTKVDAIPILYPVISASTITLTTTLKVPTYFLGMIGISEFTFPMISKTTQAMGTLEVAMVLDNSGSMAGTKISTLITAATNLTTTLYNLGPTSTKPDPVKVALVPFASSVKIDPANATAAWMDLTGVAPYNGENVELAAGSPPVSTNLPAAQNVLNMYNTLSGTGSAWAGCVEERKAPYDVTDDVATTGTPATMFVPMFAPDEPDNWTCTTGTCPYAGTTTAKRRFNGAPAGAQSYNNYLPDGGSAATCSSEFNTFTVTKASPAVFTKTAHGLTVGTPIVFSTTGALYTGLTAGIPYYVLAAGLTANAFRVTATSGSTTAVNTSGSQSGTQSYNKAINWTCAGGSALCDATSGKSEQTALLGQNVPTQNICKYGTVATKAPIAQITVATNGGTYPGGPNFNCTTQVVTPLTITKSTVTTAIGNMVANGTTNITGGLAWGWRVLSSGAPFTEGRLSSVADNQKIIVLMTDGENTYFANGKFTVSHYGAWGYISKSHLGTTSTDENVMQGKMEERMELACANIKAAGIKIYTVAFEITDVNTLGLLSACASDTSMAFKADTPADLTAAFTAIGEKISLLRISQ